MRPRAPAALLVAALAFVLGTDGAALAADASAVANAPPPADVAVGAAIYLQGIDGSGAPLIGRRTGSLDVRGADAACRNCHQRSGLGAQEGNVLVPPIAGRYLFAPTPGRGKQVYLPYVPTVHPYRSQYTRATLARAIRDGVDADGKVLGPLMPRYSLDAPDMDALIDYLNTLEPEHAPGVTATLLHFATIITPDADPVARKGMLDVLENFFEEKNTFPFPPQPLMRASGLGYYQKYKYRSNQKWRLHVWQLSGPPDRWGEELRRDEARDPVMVVVSGLGRNVWGPVHDFCEQERVPCLFPNVDVPVVAKGDFYSLYFSRGVLLEAALIAGALETQHHANGLRRVLQVYRRGDSGEAASRSLAQLLERSGIEVVTRAIDGPPGGHLQAVLRGAHADDALVLWLRPPDLRAIGSPSGVPATVFVSGLMGGLEDAPLPPAWRSRVRIAYPVDLPDLRVIRLDYPLGWFRIRHIPVVAATVQVNTYVACGLLSETLNDMSDNLQRAYLVEMLDRLVEHHFLTGYFPKLTLAPGEDVASRGGYIVQFAAPTGTRLLADGGWTVP